MNNEINQAPKTLSVLKESFDTYKKNIKFIILLFLTPFILSYIPSLFFSVFLLNNPENQALTSIGVVGIIIATLSILGSFLSMFAIYGLINFFPKILNNEKVGIKESFSIGIKFFWPVLGVSILSTLVILGGFSLLIVPGIYFAMYFTFAFYALIIDGQRGTDALLYCWNISRKRFLFILSRMFFFGVIVLLVAFLIYVLIALISYKMIGLNLGSGAAEIVKNYITILAETDNVSSLGNLTPEMIKVSKFNLITGFVNYILQTFVLTPLYFLFLYKIYTFLKTTAVAEAEEVILKRKKRIKRLAIWGGFVVVGVIVISAVFAYLGIKNSEGIKNKFEQMEEFSTTTKGEWINFQSEEGFSVLLPSQPQSSSNEFPIEGTDLKFKLSQFSSLSASGVFGLQKISYPADFDFSKKDEVLNNFLDGFVSTQNEGELVYSNFIEVQGNRAIDFSLKTGDEILKGKIILSGQDIYVVVMNYLEVNYDEESYKKFIESFRIN